MATIKGFFTKEQLGAVSSDGIIGECQECGLYRNCKNPRQEVVGKGKRRILIIGSTTGETEDKSGIPMTGKSGKFLKDALKDRGINFEEDCWKINAVACHAAKGTTRKNVKCCNPRVMKAIADLKPLHIWLLGDDAVATLFMDRESNTSINRWRATCIPLPEYGAWVVPMYHPQYILKNEKDDHLMGVFKRDLDFAITCSKHKDPPEVMEVNKHIRLIKDFDAVIKELQKIIDNPPAHLVFDYETTGLKPYKKGHKIATINICYDYDDAFGFPYEYRTHFTKDQIRAIGDLWIQIMSHPKIKLIAQNSKFEDAWTREMFGEEPEMWWCTMNTSHILDGRTEFTGLKFQALIRWGIPDYDAKIEKYLKSVSKDNPFNRVMEAPLNDLLLYGGIDALLTFRMQIEQEEELRPFRKMQSAREFYMKGLKTLCDIQENGIAMSRQYYIDTDKELTTRLAKMRADLSKFPESVLFEKVKHRPINFGSDHDLRALFFDIMKLSAGKQTAGGSDSVDASVLAELDTPIAKEITKISKLDKVQGTYLAQFLREIDDDNRMRPFFDLHVPRTYRGSSSNPNFQNIPIRDEEAKIITRSGIMPSDGNFLIDWDYGAMEVRIIACYTQDPVLMAYIFDESTDMHRDMAKDIFAFGESTWNAIPKGAGKKLRFEAKNGATFPWFYGSYFRTITRALYAKCMQMETYEGINLLEHLRSVGIITDMNDAYQQFENHIKRVEERFWLKFKLVKKWQEQAWKDYIAKGYIEQMFGFRCSGYLSRNDVVNWPVQGTAFHCLVWSINEINRRMKEQQMRSMMNGQIHDCCLTDCYPPEKQRLMAMSQQIAAVEIREAHKWLNVPLLIEWEMTEINKPWGSKIETREDE